jgi:hypothetical protein
MYPQPRRFLWYLAFIVLFLFVLKSPVLAGHLVRLGETCCQTRQARYPSWRARCDGAGLA